MAYKNIVFVKLEKRLLNDYRWFTMSDKAQLIYVKLILLAAETYNKIPKNDNVLREALRCRLELKDFQNCLNEVKANFPKLKENKHFRYFDEFEHKTNYLPTKQSLSNRSAIAQQGADKEEEEDKEKKKSKKKNPPISDEDFLKSLKSNPAYKHIDFAVEFGKMDAWLLTRKGKQKTRRFIVNWLNRVEKSVNTGHTSQSQVRRDPKPNPKCTNCKGTGKFKHNEKEIQCWCVA